MNKSFVLFIGLPHDARIVTKAAPGAPFTSEVATTEAMEGAVRAPPRKAAQLAKTPSHVVVLVSRGSYGSSWLLDATELIAQERRGSGEVQTYLVNDIPGPWRAKNASLATAQILSPPITPIASWLGTLSWEDVPNPMFK
jgi:hypothetical protein